MTSKIVENVPSFGVAAVRDSFGRRKGGTAQITAMIDDKTFTTKVDVITDTCGRRWLRCSCGAKRRYLYVQNGKVGCRGCLGLLYWEQTAIPRDRWREQVARPALKAWRRAQRQAGARS